MKRLSFWMLIIVLAVVGLMATDSPATLTENERLRAGNLVLQIENTSTRMELLALQHRQLQERQQELAKELAVLGAELLKARKLDAAEWFVDWTTLEIKPRPMVARSPAPISPEKEPKP